MLDLKQLIRATPLRPILGVARRAVNQVRNLRGAKANLDGRELRFLVGSAPPEVQPPETDWVRYADYHMSRAFMAAIQQGAYVADVGAFQGTYTVLAAACAGASGKVFAFEPVETSRLRLSRNLKLNRFAERVEICPYAVADASGEAVFYVAGTINENSLYRSGIPAECPAKVAAITVKTVALDGFFERVGRGPDVMKVDTEGAEFAVLRGAEKIVASGARIVCEMHPYAWDAAGHSQDDLVNWLEARGRIVIDLRTKERVSGAIRYGPYALETLGGSGMLQSRSGA